MMRTEIMTARGLSMVDSLDNKIILFFISNTNMTRSTTTAFTMMTRMRHALSYLLLANGILLNQQQHQVAAQSDQGTSLAGGLIVTRTNVQKYADLAQDLAEMQKFVDNGSVDNTMTLFEQGLHAKDEDGILFPLMHFGDALFNAKTKTPPFLYHLYGLTDRSTSFSFELQPESSYVNKFIKETIEEDLARAPDAVLTVGMWMYLSHLMYDGVYRCHERTKADDANVIEIGGGGFDEFIALYIGDGQDVASSNGDSLYAFAQYWGEIFDTNDPEAPVNQRILNLYTEAKAALSVQGACSNAVPGTAPELWKITTQIMSQMSIPLFQGLLYTVLNGEKQGAKVFAKALVPQISKCRGSTYRRLKQNLLDNGELDDATTAEILADLQDAYACFGFTCMDIGDYDDDRLVCNSEATNPRLAGYRPLTDVSAVARVDLDVLQIHILASLMAYVFAEYQYMYGANVFKFGSRSYTQDTRYVSLHDIAVSSERSNAGQTFGYFEDYFDEKDYADTIVRDALTGKSKFLATQQIAATASLTCAYMITFMEAIAKLRIGVADCRESDGEGLSYTLDPVDEAAALIVGSMGGTDFGGAEDREDGQLMFSLANRLAFEFDTLNDDGYAAVNSEIIDLLFAARAEIDALDCDDLEVSVDLLEMLLTVGIIQAAIDTAVQNEALSGISTATTVAEGEIYSKAVLPYFLAKTPGSAQIIETNMIWSRSVKPVEAGSSRVAEAFGYGLTYAIGLRCNFLGTTAGVNPCKNVSPNDGTNGFATKPRRSAAVSSALSATALVVALIGGLVVCM